MKTNFSGLHTFGRNVEALEKQVAAVLEKEANELGKSLLANVKKNTPTSDGVYDIERRENGKVKLVKIKSGGTLRRSWRIKPAVKEGKRIVVRVKNPVLYASYVEYGHRQEVGRYVPAIGKRLTQSFVEGKYMLRDATLEVQKIAPKQVEEALRRYLERGLHGK